MIELNNIYNCDCLDGMKQMANDSVDLTVTSCPYDNLRKYTDKSNGECEWNFDIFKPIADELYRVTKKGGVVVWVVGDACINGGETGSSFRQALYFQEIGFKLHDTMIYEKNSSSFPARLTSQRYTQIFEYMFIFSKGKIRNDIRLIADKRNKWAGWTNWGQHSQYDAEGNLIQTTNIKPIAEFSLRNNIWKYSVSFNDKTGHPAVFPEELARDHILSWSLEGETVLDPFMGSGTTAKMAMLNNRNYIGFERNYDYYIESLKRVGKYNGQVADNVSSVTCDNQGTQLELQFVYEDDSEEQGKIKLWKELTSELEKTFNETSLGILKNLRVNLSYASKANDERVKKVCEERGEFIEKPVAENNLPTIEELDEYNSSTPVPEIECTVTEELEPVETPDNNPTVEELQEYGNGKGIVPSEKSVCIKEWIPVDEYIDKCVSKSIESHYDDLLKRIKSDLGLESGRVNLKTQCGTIPESVLDVINKPKRGRPKGSKNKKHENLDI